MYQPKGKVNIVFGGNAGSESKGKIAGYLAIRDNYPAAISSFMPNAGHCFVKNDGEVVMVQSIPQACVNPDTELFISAGSAIDLKLFNAEIDRYGINPGRIFIHPRVLIIQDEHKEREASHLNRVSSTLKGCGEALADKARRAESTILAENCEELRGMVEEDFVGALMQYLDKGSNILMETPQGFDLDYNHGVSYPFCTSRQTTPLQGMADAGLPHTAIGEVIAVIRPYPIRVGDAFDKETGEKIGTSGWYPSPEISWEEVASRSGMPREEIGELATVSKKLRRVFEPDFDRMALMVKQTGATQLALNFANYLDYSVQGATTPDQLTDRVWDFIEKVVDATGVPVTLVGTGPKDCEIVELDESFYVYSSNRVKIAHVARLD